MGADARIAPQTRTFPRWMFPNSGFPSSVATKTGAHTVSSVSAVSVLIAMRKVSGALRPPRGAVSGTRSDNHSDSWGITLRGGLWQPRPRSHAAQQMLPVDAVQGVKGG